MKLAIVICEAVNVSSARSVQIKNNKMRGASADK